MIVDKVKERLVQITVDNWWDISEYACEYEDNVIMMQSIICNYEGRRWLNIGRSESHTFHHKRFRLAMIENDLLKFWFVDILPTYLFILFSD